MNFRAHMNTGLSRWLTTLGLTVISLVLNAVLRPITESNLLFLSIAAVAASSVIGGFTTGAVSTVLSALGFSWFFLNLRSAPLTDPQDVLRICTFLVTGLSVSVLGGSLRSALAVAREARKRAEEATRSRDEFISIVSHELKTPMTALKMRAELSLRRTRGAQSPNAETDHTLAESVIRELGRLQRIVGDLQDIAQAAHGKLAVHVEPTDLTRVISSAVDPLRVEFEKKGIALELNLPTRLEAEADPFRIGQVVSNLLSNAIKYGEGQPIAVNAKEHGASVQIVIEDYGPGIPLQDQRNLFQPFERIPSSQSISGTGLGLYISRLIVELHGGQISLESDQGQGARFVVSFPKRNARAPGLLRSDVSSGNLGFISK